MGQLRFDAPPYRQGIPFTQEIVGYIGVVLIATGVIAICPLNILLDVRTTSR